MAAVVLAEMTEATILDRNSYGDPESNESSPSSTEIEAQEARNPELIGNKLNLWSSKIIDESTEITT